MKKTVLLSLLVLCLAFSAAAQEAETKPVTGQTDDGLVLLKSDDGKFNLALDGRINLSAALYSGNETPLGNGMEVRRARLGLKPTWATGSPSSTSISRATKSTSRTCGSATAASNTSRSPSATARASLAWRRSPRRASSPSSNAPCPTPSPPTAVSG